MQCTKQQINYALLNTSTVLHHFLNAIVGLENMLFHGKTSFTIKNDNGFEVSSNLVLR